MRVSLDAQVAPVGADGHGAAPTCDEHLCAARLPTCDDCFVGMTEGRRAPDRDDGKLRLRGPHEPFGRRGLAAMMPDLDHVAVQFILRTQ